MWWSRKDKGKEKSFSFSKSTTTVSTSVSVNGRQMELPDGANLNEIKATLMQAGLDADTIQSVVASMGQVSAETETRNQVKVDCSACGRTVNYGKGQCMYCGNSLSLPADNTVASKSIDAEILESAPTESEQASAETAFINRLKDI